MKPTLTLTLPLLLALLMAHGTGNAQKVYRSVDPQGNVIYSDDPPANAAQVQTVDLPPGPTEEQVKQAQELTREIKASADKLAGERMEREKIAAEKRRLEQERERAAEQDARIARLESMQRNRDYWDYGVYSPYYRPHRPIIEHPIERPIQRPDGPSIQPFPKPGLPPVQGLSGRPLLRTR